MKKKTFKGVKKGKKVYSKVKMKQTLPKIPKMKV